MNIPVAAVVVGAVAAVGLTLTLGLDSWLPLLMLGLGTGATTQGRLEGGARRAAAHATLWSVALAAWLAWGATPPRFIVAVMAAGFGSSWIDRPGHHSKEAGPR